MQESSFHRKENVSRGFSKVNQIHLQLFAQEKTEEATPRRRQEARKKGQVFKSQEISSAFLFLVGFFTFHLLLPYMGRELEKLFIWTFSLEPTTISLSNITSMFSMFLLTSFIKIISPLWGAVLIIGLVANYVQVGFIFTGEPLLLKIERLNPLEGWKRIFSRRSLMQLGKSVIKLVVIGYIIYSLLAKNLERLMLLSLLDMDDSIKLVGEIAFQLGIYAGVSLLFLGLLDLIYQRWEYDKSLMMSKQEIKEELKQQEGDPQIRSRIRERQRQISARRMMAEVPQADVIVINPVHYAIALKYDAKTMQAPEMVAKGRGYIAQRIRDIALLNDIPQVENPPLAKGLYWAIEPGDEIPSEFYQAVAEVLALIYRLKAKQQGMKGG